MNQNASSLSNSSISSGTDAASLLTTVHLAWIMLLALIVVAGIVYGARISARRKAADRAVQRHVEEAHVAAAPPPGTVAEAPAAPSGTDATAASGPVTQLKGLGPKVAARLAELGVATVGQLAALDDDGARALDERMGPFQGRLERDRWVEQARFLAAGDVKGFEAVFGRL